MSRRRRKRSRRAAIGGLIGLVAVAALVLLALEACAPVYQGEAILGPLDTSDPQVAQGERVFAAQCASCHPDGSKGLGLGIINKPLPGWLIAFQVRNGVGAMPAFPPEEIGDEELEAVVAYLHALRERSLEAEPAAR